MAHVLRMRAGGSRPGDARRFGPDSPSSVDAWDKYGKEYPFGVAPALRAPCSCRAADRIRT